MLCSCRTWRQLFADLWKTKDFVQGKKQHFSEEVKLVIMNTRVPLDMLVDKVETSRLSLAKIHKFGVDAMWNL